MKTAIFIAAFLLVCETYAQEKPSIEIDPQRFVDDLLANQDGDLNYADLYENLMQLLSNPMDLNRISKEQLEALFFVPDQVVEAVLQYRSEAGPFLSVYELQNVPGMSRELFYKLSPFVTILTSDNRSFLNRLTSGQNSYLVVRYDRTLETKQGYSDEATPSTRYAGSPDRIYMRFRTSRPGDYSFGITAEKDAGEEIAWVPERKQFGPDYFSFHGQVQNKGKIKNLIVGDYQAQFGQGLLLGSAFGIGKSAEAVTTIRKPDIGFLPYTSVYESRFLRGAALTYTASKRISIHGMYSAKWRDGNVLDTLNDESAISSLSDAGLHRTANELADKNTLHEQNIMTGVTYRHGGFDVGVLIHHTRFNRSIVREPTPYNQFYFQGNQNTNAGVYFNYTVRNLSFFGEGAQTMNSGGAVLVGMIASLTSTFDLSILYRNYSRSYNSFYSNAIAENSIPQNERGVYWGWKYQFSKQLAASGYIDLFRFPWLRYRSYSPGTGSEWLLRLSYRINRNTSVFLQVTEETKQRNVTNEANLYTTAAGTKRNYWLNLEYAATPALQFRTRAQFNTYSLNKVFSQGMVLLQDVTYNFGKVSVSGRYALFDTDSYDNRIYIYERDVWLAFTFPAYEGVGVKNYLLVQYNLTRQIDIWGRWSFERYTDRDEIGSSGETIAGNRQNDIRFQVRIRF